MVKHGSIDKVYHAMFFLLKEKVPSILRPVLKKTALIIYFDTMFAFPLKVTEPK